MKFVLYTVLVLTFVFLNWWQHVVVSGWSIPVLSGQPWSDYHNELTLTMSWTVTQLKQCQCPDSDCCHFGQWPLSCWTMTVVMLDNDRCHVGQWPLSCWTMTVVMLDNDRCHVGQWPLSCWTMTIVMLDNDRCHVGQWPLSSWTMTAVILDNDRCHLGQWPLPCLQ
jgi:hypothetical protein